MNLSNKNCKHVITCYLRKAILPQKAAYIWTLSKSWTLWDSLFSMFYDLHHMCVTQEYQYYAMSLSQYHGCCQYNKYMSIPCVFANTMSQCLYHEFMSNHEFIFVPWVHVCTKSRILYHEFMSIPWVFFQILAFISIPLKMQLSDIQKYK